MMHIEALPPWTEPQRRHPSVFEITFDVEDKRLCGKAVIMWPSWKEKIDLERREKKRTKRGE